MDNETIATSGQENRAMPLSLSNMETDTIGEILNISMGAAATAISTLLGRKVSITTPTVSLVNASQLQLNNLEPAVGIEIQYVEGLSGNNLLVLKSKDVRAIVNLLLGDMGGQEDDELGEIHISAVCEIMNQMMGASSTALSSFLGKSINISTPSQFEIASKLAELDSDSEQPDIVSVRFMLEVEDLLNSEFMTIMPVAFTKELVQNAMNFDDLADVVLTPVKKEAALPVTKSEAPIQANEKRPKRDEERPRSSQVAARPAPVSVKPVRLQSFDEEIVAESVDEESDNFNLILGVPLEVSVEIGRTKMSVKNVLDIRQGSIVELDRQAGDPVDVIVNGQLIARGDVVIVDDNFGVRIIEILSKSDIAKSIN